MIIDIGYIFIIILAVYKGVSKGFIVGIFSLVAFIIGLAAALKLSAIVALHLQNQITSSAKWLPVISFALVFMVVVLLVSIGARLIKKALAIALLGWLDRLVGIALYIVIYTIVFSIILFFADKIFLIKKDVTDASVVYKYVIPWGPYCINNLGKIIPLFKDMFVQLENFFEAFAKKYQ